MRRDSSPQHGLFDPSYIQGFAGGRCSPGHVEGPVWQHFFELQPDDKDVLPGTPLASQDGAVHLQVQPLESGNAQDQSPSNRHLTGSHQAGTSDGNFPDHRRRAALLQENGRPAPKRDTSCPSFFTIQLLP